MSEGEMMGAKRAILAYMPVYHRGWAELLEAESGVGEIVLLPGSELKDLGWPVHKDIHGLAAGEIAELLRGLGRWEKVVVMDEAKLGEWRELVETGELELIIADDAAVEAWVREKLGADVKVHKKAVFVRWTRENAMEQKEVTGDKVVSEGEIKAKIMAAMEEARVEGEKSSDWWRQVGAVLLLPENRVIVKYNQHLPESETPNIRGDVRAQFHKGVAIELTSAIHAEAAAIAEAARRGWQSEGGEIVVTDFPCPVCAKQIAAAGIKRVYFQRGYAMLDGEEILRGAGVEIIRVGE